MPQILKACQELPATTAAPPAPNPKADIVLAEDLSSLTI